MFSFELFSYFNVEVSELKVDTGRIITPFKRFRSLAIYSIVYTPKLDTLDYCLSLFRAAPE